MHLNGDCPILNTFDTVALVVHGAPEHRPGGALLTYPTTYGAATRYATKYNSFGSDSARVLFEGFNFNIV